MTVKTAAEIWRDFATESDPTTAAHKPVKADIRQWGANIEALTAAGALTAAVFKATKSALDSDLAHAAGVLAVVYADATPANNAIYIKSGSSGSGSWGLVGYLPTGGYVPASNAGSGTADAIVATTPIAVSEYMLICLPFVAANTISGPTVAFNGGSPLTIKTISNADFPAGGAVAGLQVLGFVSGSTFRLLSDYATSAAVEGVVAEATAWAQGTEPGGGGTKSAKEWAEDAESFAGDAETARDAAFLTADIYADEATGRAAVSNGEQFSWVDGDEIVRSERVDASNSTEVARFPTVSILRRRPATNLVNYPGLDGGASNPAIRSGSVIGDVPAALHGLRNMGYTKALNWRQAGSDYVRYYPPDDTFGDGLNGRYYIAGFLAESTTLGDIPNDADVYSLSSVGGSLSTPASQTQGRIQLDDGLWLLYNYGQLAAVNVRECIVGSGTGPTNANSLYASGFFLIFDDAPFTLNDLPQLAQPWAVRLGQLLAARIATAEADIDAAEADIDDLETFQTNLLSTIVQYNAGDNLYNPAEKQSGTYVGSANNGALLSATDWACTDYIPVTPGTHYTISSNATKRVGVAFFASESPTDTISGGYSSSSANPLTVTAPAGSAFMVVNVASNTIPEPSEIMINVGSSALPYEAWAAPTLGLQSEVVSAELVDARGDFDTVGDRLDSLTAPPRARLTLLGANAEGYIEADRDGVTIQRKFTPTRELSLISSGVFNFGDEKVDGVTVKTGPDDTAPYRASTTVGANHGYLMGIATATGHGKVQADIGSVWSSGGQEYVILGVADADTLYLADRDSNTAVPTGTFTHVSGATNTGNITVTSVTSNDWFPAYQNRTIRCFVDDVEVSVATVKDYQYSKSAVFIEAYEVLPRSEIISWFESNGDGGTIQASGDPEFAVSIVYRFDVDGHCTITTDFLSLASMTLQDIMFAQAGRMSAGVDGAVNYYIPKVDTVTHESVSYDFAMIDEPDTSGWSSRLDFTPARCVDNADDDEVNWPASRVVQLTDNYGFAIGYLPVGVASTANRATNTTTKRLQISDSSGKIYPAAVDKGTGTIAANVYHQTVAYRNLLVLPTATGRTCAYPVRTEGDDYFFVDWHDFADVDRVALPPDFAGRSFEVVEKRNVTLRSSALTGHIVCDVSASGDYAYLILKIT